MRAAPPAAPETTRPRPECEPWLVLLGQAFTPALEPTFARMVGAPPSGRDGDRVPLLAGATVTVEAGAYRRFLSRLLTTATEVAGAERAAPLDEAASLAVLPAALNQDGAALVELAGRTGIDPGQLAAVAQVAVMPLLHAHRRAWASHVSPHWVRSFCPVCGAWPGLVEVRGLDRTRRFRCLRCAADWTATWLACPYCGNREHTELGALVPEAAAETRRAETCARCRGYLKCLATLQATEPARLAFLDVETIELDLAAIAQGYARPEGPGHRLDVRVEPGRARGVFGWRR